MNSNYMTMLTCGIVMLVIFSAAIYGCYMYWGLGWTIWGLITSSVAQYLYNRTRDNVIGYDSW